MILFRRIVTLFSIFIASVWSMASSSDPVFVRQRDLSHLPQIEITNATGSPNKIRISSSLEGTDGLIGRQAEHEVTLAGGEKAVVQPYEELRTLSDEIALLRTTVTFEDGTAYHLSAIVGTPQPVDRNVDSFFGMNAHLHRYSAQEQWRILQLMKAAGISSVRIEPGFRSYADDEEKEQSLVRFDETLLGAEAFGMNSLFALTYFPRNFYDNEEKLKQAEDWARLLAERYQGRVHDWQYGNEANSGWATFGAAADMALHNMAMAHGTRSVDPDARTSSFGIAEGLPAYLNAYLDAGAGAYLDAITVHPYCGVPEAGVAKMEENRRVIRAHGGDQEIWATEIGFHFDEPGNLNSTTQQLTLVNGFSLEQQADMLARLFILSRAKGIERVYWYNMYGKNDRETFWLVDGDFNERPAYHALKTVTPYLRDVTYLGGTDSAAPIQEHLFRRADGSAFLTVWALRNGVEYDLNLPGGDYVATDAMGQPVAIGDASSIQIGERPIFIEGLGEQTDSWLMTGVFLSSIDGRNWNRPLNRWDAKAGDDLEVPYVVYNSKDHPVTVSPVLLKSYPGWDIVLPEPFSVAAGETVREMVKVKVPDTAVPGVPYRLRFGARSEGPHHLQPYEARIWLEGAFPYEDILNGSTGFADYKTRRDVDESKVGFGRQLLNARYGSVEIDGDLGDWDAEDFYTLDQVGNWQLRDSGQPMREDWFARGAIRWDDEWLYVAFLVMDDDLSTLDQVSRDWRDSDNVRIFISNVARGERSRLISENDFLIYMAPTGLFQTEAPSVHSASLGGYLHDGFENNVRLASRIWDGGYLIEAAIPFQAMGITPAEGLELGVNLLGDDADKGFRTHTGMTTFNSLDYWNSPKSLGELRLIK